MLDNNLNNKYQVPLQALSPAQAQQLKAMQDNQSNPEASMQGGTPMPVNPDKIKQEISDTYVANRLAQMEQNDKIKQVAIAVPVWYGLSQSMDWFANGCRKEYKDTIQYKMGNFGDNVSNTVSNSKFGQSTFAKSVNNGAKRLRGWFKTNLVERFAITRAFAHTPSKPELDIVKGQANGITGALLFDYPQVAENFMKPLKYAEDLDCYGANSYDKDFIKNTKEAIKNAANKVEKQKILQEAEFELLSGGKKELAAFKKLDVAAKGEWLRNLKAKAFGYNDFAHFEFIKGDIQNHVKDVIKASKKANPKMYSKVWSHDQNIFGKIMGHLFGRKVFASEFSNKLVGSLGISNPEHKTLLGKYLPKLSNIFLEGSTNRVAGGKLVAMMQAWFLAEAIIKTVQADKGDKTRTFAERFIELTGFFIAMPMAIQLMHKFGGVQYASMSTKQFETALKNLDPKKFKSPAEFKAAKDMLAGLNRAGKHKNPVDAYREVLKIFNDKASVGGFKTKAEYNAAKKALSGALNGETKNIFTKLFKRIGRTISIGLEQFKPFRETSLQAGKVNRFLDFFKNPKYWTKQMAGYPVRIGLAMMMIMPFLNKIGVKVSHAMFGKPKHSVLDKDVEGDLTKERQDKIMKEAIAAQELQAKANGGLPPQQVPPVKAGQPIQAQGVPPVQPLAPQNQTQQVQAETPQGVQPQTRYQSTTTTQSQYTPQVGASPTGLLNKYKNGQINQTTTTTTNTVNNIPAKLDQQDDEPVRTYIPSPVGVQVKGGEDPTAADAALKRAEAAERKAMETLAMK